MNWLYHIEGKYESKFAISSFVCIHRKLNEEELGQFKEQFWVETCKQKGLLSLTFADG
jgi:hypothetical protein